jgi:penicillin-binding protein-related factor A (putative recombinase)
LNRYTAGKGFENVLERITAQAGILCIRIPDGCQVVGLNKLVRRKTPFDYILCKDSKCALIDAKTTIGKTFSITSDLLIKPHQISIMKQANEKGIIAGFLFLFRLTETLCFMEANELEELKYQGKKSIGPQDCMVLGRLGEDLDWNKLWD